MGLKRVKWNFEKFLIGRDGKVKGRWASTTKPENLASPILAEIEKAKSTTTPPAAAPAAGSRARRTPDGTQRARRRPSASAAAPARP